MNDTRIHTRIQSSEPVSGVRLFTVPTGLRGITRIAGSMLGGDWYSPADNGAVAGIVADMLDEGTRRHSKHALAERLENVGSSLSYTTGSHHVRFSGAARPSDSELLIETLAEELRESAFRAGALRSVAKRVLGTLDAEVEDTETQASIALTQRIFPNGHPNRVRTTARAQEDVRRVCASSLRTFHRKMYGSGSLLIVAAGESDHALFEKSIRTHFGGWNHSPLILAVPEHAATVERGDSATITISDKTSVNVVLGAAIGISAKHEDFYPLVAGFGVLGGLPFVSRLFQGVRERLGLTYHITAGLEGMHCRADGYWVVRASFAPSLLKQGREAIEHELERFVERGVSARELDEYKEAVLGSYVVGLASAVQVAQAVRGVIEQEHSITFLDEYLEIIRTLTLRDVNSAITRYVYPDKAYWIAAGSVGEGER